MKAVVTCRSCGFKSQIKVTGIRANNPLLSVNSNCFDCGRMKKATGKKTSVAEKIGRRSQQRPIGPGLQARLEAEFADAMKNAKSYVD